MGKKQPRKLSPAEIENEVDSMIERIAGPYGIRSRARLALLRVGIDLAQHMPLDQVQDRLSDLFNAMAENWGDGR